MPKEFELPAYRLDTTSLIAYEYILSFMTGCLSCGSPYINLRQQSALPPKEELPLPVGGDKLTFYCEECDSSSSFIFHFVKPEEGKREIDFVEELLDSLLDKCSFRESYNPPDYYNFILYFEKLFISIFLSQKMYSRGVYKLIAPQLEGKLSEGKMEGEEFLRLISDKIMYFSDNALEKNLDDSGEGNKMFHKLKLLLRAVAEMPEREFSFVENRLSPKLQDSVKSIRKKFYKGQDFF